MFHKIHSLGRASMQQDHKTARPTSHVDRADRRP